MTESVEEIVAMIERAIGEGPADSRFVTIISDQGGYRLRALIASWRARGEALAEVAKGRKALAFDNGPQRKALLDDLSELARSALMLR